MSKLMVALLAISLMLMSLGISPYFKNGTAVSDEFCQSQGFEESKLLKDEAFSLLDWAPGEQRSSVVCIDRHDWFCEIKAPKEVSDASWKDRFVTIFHSRPQHVPMRCNSLWTFEPDLDN